MLKVFVSYSHDDNHGDDISQLADILRKRISFRFSAEVKFYFDAAERAGGDLSAELKREIKNSDIFICIVTPSYLRPDYVAYSELVYYAETFPIEKRDTFLPIVLKTISSDDKRGNNVWDLINKSRYVDLIDAWDNRFSEVNLLQNIIERETRLLKDAFEQRYKSKNKREESPISHDLTKQIETEISELRQQVKFTGKNTLFRNSMVLNILKSFNNEIKALNSKEYNHDISLDRNFVLRAEPIFSTSAKVFAVSIDSASSFWLNPKTKNLAINYTKHHPKDTIRLFVFSSPQSMLRHRWVLKHHFEQYGSTGEVLMTSQDRWTEFIDEFKKSSKFDGAHKNIPGLGEDFGILTYHLKDKKIEAKLDNTTLSFRETSDLSPFYKHFIDAVSRQSIEDLNGLKDVIYSEETEYGIFWKWIDLYSAEVHDNSWFSCVADIFDGDIDFSPTNNSKIMHNVLLSTPDHLSEKDFEVFMKSCMNHLLSIEKDSKPIVKSMWFGRKSENVNVTDKLHKGTIIIDTTPGFYWEYCLTTSFNSPKDLEFYYQHEIHCDVRKRLYEKLNPSVRELYNMDDEGAGEIVESIMKKHVARLDYEVPDQNIVYSSIEAPTFE